MFATEQKEEKGKIEVKNAREFVRHKTCSNILFDFVGSYIFFSVSSCRLTVLSLFYSF